MMKLASIVTLLMFASLSSVSQASPQCNTAKTPPCGLYDENGPGKTDSFSFSFTQKRAAQIIIKGNEARLLYNALEVEPTTSKMTGMPVKAGQNYECFKTGKNIFVCALYIDPITGKVD